MAHAGWAFEMTLPLQSRSGVFLNHYAARGDLIAQCT